LLRLHCSNQGGRNKEEKEKCGVFFSRFPKLYDVIPRQEKKEDEEKEKKQRETMGLKNLYLAAYNGVQTAGWGFVLVTLVSALWAQFTRVAQKNGGDYVAALQDCDAYDLTGLWAAIGPALVLFQNLAALEIVHSLLGLVRSPFFTTFVQVLSRLLLVNVTNQWASVQAEWGMVMMVTAWCITEVVRYFFFLLKELNVPIPFALSWLRYSMFFVLYPVGVAGELMTMWNSKPEFEKLQSRFSVEVAGLTVHTMHFFYLCLVCYVPGLPVMYMHMISQRGRTLYGSSKSSGKKTGAAADQKKKN
jgi:very-long-chain (3R)-3-hydroxyacyl-CoA dehydratase